MRTYHLTLNCSQEEAKRRLKLQMSPNVLGGYVDDAQFMVRFNQKKPKSVKGGELTHLTGNLYLLEANKSTVTVHFE